MEPWPAAFLAFSVCVVAWVVMELARPKTSDGRKVKIRLIALVSGLTSTFGGLAWDMIKWEEKRGRPGLPQLYVPGATTPKLSYADAALPGASQSSSLKPPPGAAFVGSGPVPQSFESPKGSLRSIIRPTRKVPVLVEKEKGPNKAPEPTPEAVTPRATEGTSN